MIGSEDRFSELRDKGAVELLSEVGTFDERATYRVDRMFVGLDPRNDYLLEDLKILTSEIFQRLSQHGWVENAYVHWIGGKGFHIIGEFKGGLWREVERGKSVL